MIPCSAIALWAASRASAFCSVVSGGTFPVTSPIALSSEDARGLPTRSALDLAASGIAGGGRDPGELERPRVRDGGVTAQVDHDDRAPRRQPVEVLFRGLPVHAGRLPEVHREPAVRLLVAAAGEDPAERGEERLQVELAVVERGLRQHEPAGERVGVAVVDARHERAAAKLDHLGRGADERRGTTARPHIGNLACADCDRLGDAVAGDRSGPSRCEGRCPRRLGRRARARPPSRQARARGERRAVANEAPARDAVPVGAAVPAHADHSAPAEGRSNAGRRPGIGRLTFRAGFGQLTNTNVLGDDRAPTRGDTHGHPRPS